MSTPLQCGGLKHCASHGVAARPCLQVFLTSRYLGIVMEYVTGGDLADMVDVWNVRNRKSHRARGPGEPIPHQCASHFLACLKLDKGMHHLPRHQHKGFMSSVQRPGWFVNLLHLMQATRPYNCNLSAGNCMAIRARM